MEPQEPRDATSPGPTQLLTFFPNRRGHQFADARLVHQRTDPLACLERLRLRQLWSGFQVQLTLNPISNLPTGSCTWHTDCWFDSVRGDLARLGAVNWGCGGDLVAHRAGVLSLYPLSWANGKEADIIKASGRHQTPGECVRVSHGQWGYNTRE